MKLFKIAFKFTGGEIVNEFLVSVGYLAGAHIATCPIHKKVLKTKPAWQVEEDPFLDFEREPPPSSAETACRFSQSLEKLSIDWRGSSISVRGRFWQVCIGILQQLTRFFSK